MQTKPNARDSWNLRKFSERTSTKHNVGWLHIEHTLNVNRLRLWWLFAFINGNVFCKLLRNRDDNGKHNHQLARRLIPECLHSIHLLGVLHHHISLGDVWESCRLFCCRAPTNHANRDKVRRKVYEWVKRVDNVWDKTKVEIRKVLLDHKWRVLIRLINISTSHTPNSYIWH